MGTQATVLSTENLNRGIRTRNRWLRIVESNAGALASGEQLN